MIELKKDRTPREVVAQALDYGFWVRQLDADSIAEMYAHHHDGASFAEAFEAFFDQPVPTGLNDSHQLIIVASELDPSTERIVSYAAAYDIPLNVVFFQYFRDGGAEYLTRSWLIDPAEAEQRSRAVRSARPRSTNEETWNGQDFYYSAGEGPSRNWDDMVAFGFISAGGGRWYSQTLKQLEPGHRVFACIPGTGYVGVGLVRESVRPVTEFEVDTPAGRLPILDAGIRAPSMAEHRDDPDLRESSCALSGCEPARGIRPSGSTGCTPTRTQSRAYASSSRCRSSPTSLVSATKTRQPQPAPPRAQPTTRRD